MPRIRIRFWAAWFCPSDLKPDVDFGRGASAPLCFSGRRCACRASSIRRAPRQHGSRSLVRTVMRMMRRSAGLAPADPNAPGHRLSTHLCKPMRYSKKGTAPRASGVDLASHHGNWRRGAASRIGLKLLCNSRAEVLTGTRRQSVAQTPRIRSSVPDYRENSDAYNIFVSTLIPAVGRRMVCIAAPRGCCEMMWSRSLVCVVILALTVVSAEAFQETAPAPEPAVPAGAAENPQSEDFPARPRP